MLSRNILPHQSRVLSTLHAAHYSSAMQRTLNPQVSPYSPSLVLTQALPCYMYITPLRCHSSEPHPPREEGVVRRGWRKVAGLISSFMTGTKSLYKDVKAMYELKRRHRLIITGVAPKLIGPGETDVGFSRAELHFMYQTQRDLWKMLPTIVLFFIPVLGYFVPLVVFMYPQHMLSQHFLTEGKKAEFVAAAAEVRGQNLRKLLGDQLQDNSEQWRQLKACLNALQQTGSLEGSLHDVASWSLKNIRGQHLERLCGMWGVSRSLLSTLLPWTRASSQRARLLSHLHYIYTADWLAQLEGGITHLVPQDKEKLCAERCLLSKEQRDMDQYLKTWLPTSTHFNECPLYLMAHLPLLLTSEQLEH